MGSICATKIGVRQTRTFKPWFLILFVLSTVSCDGWAAPCPRPKDFSNRAATEQYDRCVEKSGFTKIQKSSTYLEKISCLHSKPSELVACRKKELNGESIKTVAVAVFGSSPTPAPGLKPLDGDVPVEDNTQKKPGTPGGPAPLPGTSNLPGGQTPPIAVDPSTGLPAAPPSTPQ